jgi:hypothetical protein
MLSTYHVPVSVLDLDMRTYEMVGDMELNQHDYRTWFKSYNRIVAHT